MDNMYEDRDIGLGGVMSQIAWQAAGQKEKGVKLEGLVGGLRKRFGVGVDYAKRVIDMAMTCGVIGEVDGKLYLRGRDLKLIK